MMYEIEECEPVWVCDNGYWELNPVFKYRERAHRILGTLKGYKGTKEIKS